MNIVIIYNKNTLTDVGSEAYDLYNKLTTSPDITFTEYISTKK